MANSISVVICSYTCDRLPLLKACVESVQAQRPAPAEVVVVVDHCPELHDEVTNWRGVKVVDNAERPGLSGARNTGLNVAAGDVVVFLDDDATAADGWLSELVRPFEDESVAGVGGSAVPRFEVSRPSWFPSEFDWVIGCSYTGQQTGDVRNPIGCNMAFRRGELLRAGGFHHSLGRVGSIPSGCEETELGIRVNRGGGRIVMVEGARVEHYVPARRLTRKYFLQRCYAEGRSKAIVSTFAVSNAGPSRRAALDPEVRYLGTLARSAQVSVKEASAQRSARPLQAAAMIFVGLVITTAGYGRGRLTR